MKKLFLIPIMVLSLGAGCISASQNNSYNSQNTSSMNDINTPPQVDVSQPPASTETSLSIDKNKSYNAILHTTLGDIEIALTAKETPVTVNNFVVLAKKNYYDNTIFHRTIKDFMIQGGDPTGTGAGDPGYRFDDEPFTGEYTRGTVAMANAGPNTNGSQFFIMHANVPLPKNYVIFGKVAKGLDVVDKIATAPVTSGANGEPSKPLNPVVIKTVDIVEK